MKRGQEVRVSRIPHAQGYVWAGYWQEETRETPRRSFVWMTGESVGQSWICHNCGEKYGIEDVPADEFFFVCPGCHGRGCQVQENWTVAHPVGRIRKLRRYVHEADAIWLDIGGYMVL